MVTSSAHLVTEPGDHADQEVVVTESAPAGEAVLVGDVVGHEDAVQVAALDQEEDLAHPLAVVGHVERRIVRVVGRLQAEEVVLEVDAGGGQLEQHGRGRRSCARCGT